MTEIFFRGLFLLFADAWSDHDFFVIVEAGSQERFRTDLSWLPDYGDVVFSYRETAHGARAVYRNGHLSEFAVFDLEELNLARVNRFRVLLDRGGVEQRMCALRAETERLSTETAPKDVWLWGSFLCDLLVGAARWKRGERPAARHRRCAGASSAAPRAASGSDAAGDPGQPRPPSQDRGGLSFARCRARGDSSE